MPDRVPGRLSAAPQLADEALNRQRRASSPSGFLDATLGGRRLGLGIVDRGFYECRD